MIEDGEREGCGGVGCIWREGEEGKIHRERRERGRIVEVGSREGEGEGEKGREGGREGGW